MKQFPADELAARFGRVCSGKNSVGNTLVKAYTALMAKLSRTLLIPLIAVMACSPTSSKQESVDAENFYSTPQARAQDAPIGLDDFAFIVGCFQLKTYMHNPASGEWTPVGNGNVRGQWALDGWAITDEWIDVPFPGWAEDAGKILNVRIFDEQKNRFVISWAHTNLPGVRDRRARRTDAGIVVWQPSPDFEGFEWEAHFKLKELGAWSRTDVTRKSESDDWIEVRRIEAIAQNCS